MKVTLYAIVFHHGKPDQRVLIDYADVSHRHAIQSFACANDPNQCRSIGESWERFRAKGYSCVKCELIVPEPTKDEPCGS